MARLLAKTNSALWNAICLTEELMLNPIILDVVSGCYDNGQFQSLQKNDDELVDVELNSAYFQSFDRLTGILRKQEGVNL